MRKLVIVLAVVATVLVFVLRANAIETKSVMFLCGGEEHSLQIPIEVPDFTDSNYRILP